MRAWLTALAVAVILFVIADVNAHNNGKHYYHLWIREVGQDVWVIIVVVFLAILFYRRSNKK